MRDLMRPGVIVLFTCALFAQSSDSQRYEFADVHVSARTNNNDSMRIAQIHSGRMEIRGATMLQLLSGAYLIDSDKILGGPNWLELDRYDVIAKVPPGSKLETQGPMLKELLKERFKLVAHEETRPVPTWALSAGKQPKLKEADGKGETGCKVRTGSEAAGESGPRFNQRNPDGTTTQINLGPGLMVQYSCRNMTMAAFADSLPSMLGVQLNAATFGKTVLDRRTSRGCGISM